MKKLFIVSIALSSFLFSDMIIYPAKGQSQDQQAKDVKECASWAQNQSGFDPANPPKVQQVAVQEQTHKADGTVLKGAAAGAIVGAAANGDVGGAALTGAGLGLAKRLVNRRRAERSAEERAQAQMASQQQNINALKDKYNRAKAACLEAKGYTIK